MKSLSLLAGITVTIIDNACTQMGCLNSNTIFFQCSWPWELYEDKIARSLKKSNVLDEYLASVAMVT